MVKIKGTKAKHCIITPTCRRESASAALSRAFDIILDEYLKIMDERQDADDCNFHLVLTVESTTIKE